jgi:hypothetical protein
MSPVIYLKIDCVRSSGQEGGVIYKYCTVQRKFLDFPIFFRYTRKRLNGSVDSQIKSGVVACSKKYDGEMRTVN